MKEKKNAPKYRNMMYEQQLAHLPGNMNPDDLFTLIETVIKPKHWAGIVHDKDVKKDGITPAEDHVHVMMQFENARYLSKVAKDIGDYPQFIEKWDNRIENGYSYLIHATKKSRVKHQYPASEVKSNFDYIAEIIKVTKSVSKVENITSSNKVNALLDMIATGDIILKEAKNQLSGSVYAKHSGKFEKAEALRLERRAEEHRLEMLENNQMVIVSWLYGQSGTGKTRLAEILASKHGDYYKTTTQKDPFQFYQAESIIILDELRPDAIPFSELLAMFDPFSYGKVTMSSRFYNKALSCDLFIVTSPYDPVTFCKDSFRHRIDMEAQLYRRLTSVLMFDMNYINKMEYNPAKGFYVMAERKDNKYSSKNQNTIITNNLFDEID